MQIQIYHTFAELPVTPESWNALVQRSSTNTIFQTYQWVKSWWEIFGYNNELFIITISGDEKLLGIAPLMLTGNSPRGKILKFIGDGKSDYCDFIILQEKEQILTEFFKLIIEFGELWDTIQLNNVPDYSITTQIISQICQFTGLKSLFFDNIPCPSLVFNGEKENILNRRSFRRKYNYFHKKGTLKFFKVTDQLLAEEYLKLLFYQHQKRWEVHKMVSLFSDYQNQEFYIKLTKNLIDTNWLLFSILEFDDQPIAMHYGFDYGNRVYWYKPAFDIHFAKHSPGLVLLRYLIEYCIENDKTELDFTIGNEKFKNRYANTMRNNRQINIYQSSARYFYNSSLYQLKNLVKKIETSGNS